MPDMPDRLNRTLCILLFAVLLVVISRQIDRWLDVEIVWRMPLRAGCALLFGSMLLYHGKTYRPKQPAQGWERAVHAAKRILYYGAGCFALAHIIGVVSTYAVPGRPEQVRLLQRPIIRGTGQPRCELGYCQGSRVGQPEKGVDVSGCLWMEDELCWAVFQAALFMERADVCLTNGWLRSIAFQAAVVFFRLP